MENPRLSDGFSQQQIPMLLKVAFGVLFFKVEGVGSSFQILLLLPFLFLISKYFIISTL